MSLNPDWLSIQKLEFKIRGIEGSAIHFVSEAVLAKRVSLTGVVLFDTTLTIHASRSIFQHSYQFADYNGLRPFRDALSKIRDDSGDTASMGDAGLALTVCRHKSGVREGLLIEGFCSSVGNREHVPWPVRKSIGDFVLTESESAACIRFAFLSSLVDPPYLDSTIAELNDIIRCLEDEGYKP